MRQVVGGRWSVEEVTKHSSQRVRTARQASGSSWTRLTIRGSVRRQRLTLISLQSTSGRSAKVHPGKAAQHGASRPERPWRATLERRGSV